MELVMDKKSLALYEIPNFVCQFSLQKTILSAGDRYDVSNLRR